MEISISYEKYVCFCYINKGFIYTVLLLMAVFAGKQNIKLFLQHFSSMTKKLLLSTEFTNDKS